MARFRDHYAFLLDGMLADVEQLEADVDEVSGRIEVAIPLCR